jgi:hypothetical protein
MDDDTTLLPGPGPRQDGGDRAGGRRDRSRGSGPGRTGGPDGPGSRRTRRRAEKASATRNVRIRRASIVVGGVLAVVAAWALVGRPGLSLVTGDETGGSGTAAGTPSTTGSATSGKPTTSPSGSIGTPTASVSPTRDPKLATLDSKLATGQPGAGGFSSSKPVVGLGPKGFAPICGGPAASDKLVLAAVTSTLKGSRAGGSVTIVQSQAVYSKGGVSALLSEAARASCADTSPSLPNFPKGTVLLRGRGSAGEAYLVAPTSASTAVFIKASSTAEDAVVDTLFSVVPGLISQAESNAADLEKSIP